MKKTGLFILAFGIGLFVNAQSPQTKTTKTTQGTTGKSTTTKTTTPAKTTAPASKSNSTPQKTTAPSKTTSAPENTKPATAAKQKPEDNSQQNTAQHPFAKGDNIINIGTGFGHFYGIFGGLVGYPSVNLSYENVFVDFDEGKGGIGLGAMLGWWTGHYYNNYWLFYTDANYRANYTRYAMALRGTVHYDMFNNPRFDIYGGLDLGVYVETSHVRYNDPYVAGGVYKSRSTSVYPLWNTYLGARYYLGKSNKFGVFGELGYGLSLFRLGIVLKP